MFLRKRSFWLGKAFFGSLLLVILGCPANQEMQQARVAAPIPKPRLVVGIVVDQMRYDYLARFWDNFGTGGFKRLIGEGMTFSNCNYNYVPTETAPGHASIFTGTTPSGHGIIMNDWFDQDQIAAGLIRPHSSVEDTNYPWVGLPPEFSLGRSASPLRLDASTIADQLKAATGGMAKTVGVSLKDRSAILPVGKSADIAFWLDDITGSIVSSTYYPWVKSGTAAWVDSVNKGYQPIRYMLAPEGWTLLLDPSKYKASDKPSDSRYEGAFFPLDPTTFPHHVKPDSLKGCGDFKSTPWGNLFAKDFAKLAIRYFQLGSDSVTDFLSLSFSSTDMVAHQFGIQSREVEDTYLRLDRDLADFLNFLDLRLGKENVLVFLTADHGGAPNPTYATDHGEKGGWIETLALHDKLRMVLGDKPDRDSLLTVVKGHNIYLNRSLAAKRNLNLDSLSKVVAKAMTGFPGVEKVYTASELIAMQPSTGPEQFLKNGFYKERSGDVLYLASYGYLAPPYAPTDLGRYKKGTSHGTHYAYDTHVPLIWWGSSIPVGKSDVAVVIPDIAPTVCSRLGIAATSKCTGKPIESLR